MSAGRLRFVDVGPRDGLQNEKVRVSLEDKVRYVEAAALTGVGEVEAGAFVSPEAVAQMADSEEVFRRIARRPGILYSALVPNERGLERALTVKAEKISVFTAASEAFNRENIRATIDESIERFRPVVAGALKAGLPVRAYISTAFHCPYSGPVAPAAVLAVAEKLLELGVEELSIGDTVGKASPREVGALMEPLLELACADKIFLHFHDTYGMAVANALAAWKGYAITGFDASSGGLGGCPYAPGASGNVALEDLAFAFSAEGGETGLDPAKIRAAVAWVPKALGHPLLSRLGRIADKQEEGKP